MTDRRLFARLTEAEALRALYIDFEGEKNRPPVLLGVYRRGRGNRPWVQQHILDEAFASLVTPAMTLREAVQNVVMRAERRDRRIVAWSEHELKVVRTLAEGDPELVERFEARFVNARRVAERWRNRDHEGRKPASGTLASYLQLIEYEVPAEGVGGDVGDTIRSVRRSLERRRQLSTTQAERWRRLLEHNRHDCIGMRRICLRATA